MTDRLFFITKDPTGPSIVGGGFMDYWRENAELFGFEVYRKYGSYGAKFIGLTLEEAWDNIDKIENEFPDRKFMISEKLL